MTQYRTDAAIHSSVNLRIARGRLCGVGEWASELASPPGSADRPSSVESTPTPREPRECYTCADTGRTT